MATILSSPIFVETIFPFLLVFTIVYALLQKTQVLGQGKRQIDAIVALVVGLLVVSFGYATNIITSLVPVLAVSAVVILIFMILAGMTFKQGSFELPNGIKVTIGILAAIVVIVALMVASGVWNYFWSYVSAGDSSVLITNVVFILIIVGALAAAIFSSPKAEPEGKPKKD